MGLVVKTQGEFLAAAKVEKLCHTFCVRRCANATFNDVVFVEFLKRPTYLLAHITLKTNLGK